MMHVVVSLFVTALCAILGGWLFMRLNIPGGMIIGAVVATTILNFTTDLAFMPLAGKLAAQISTGAFVACSVKKGDFRRITQNWRALLFLILGLFLLNLISGTVLYALTDLDRITCYLSVVPGGTSDIPMIAEEVGGDPAVVLVAQLFRVIVGLTVFPLIAARLADEETLEQYEVSNEREAKSRTENSWRLIVTFLIAAIGGLFVRGLGVPAGALVGSMLVVLAYNACFSKATMSRSIRRTMQSLAGAYIGCSIGKENLKLVINTAYAMILIGLLFTIGCLVLAYILNRKSNLSPRASLLAAMPAGASDVALIAADMNINMAEIAVLQIIRLIAAIAVFPQMILLLLEVGFPFF